MLTGMMSPKEVAYKFKISYKTVMRLIKTSKITAYKVGRHYKVLECDLECYLANNKVNKNHNIFH